MKKIIFILSVLLISFNNYAQKKMRDPFVVLLINGTEYKSDSEIEVRPGERIKLTAVLKGGRRDYCTDPDTYANVGKNTVITNKGEDGMSFHIGGGTFRGTWSLKKENAEFKTSDKVKVIKSKGNEIKTNEAIVEIPKSGISKVYFKVTVSTKWKYARNTQAGYSEKFEDNKGTNTFYFVLTSDEGVWYSSANLTAKGTENFSVRNALDQVQRAYDDIYSKLLKRDFDNLNMYVNNLKTSISSLKNTINDEKKKDEKFECEVSFIGLPTTMSMTHLESFEKLSNKWKGMFLIAQGNVSQINDMLLKVQMGLSSNILKSVFKNYITWSGSLPTGATDFLTLYDPSNVLKVSALPGNVLGWWESANSDATILNNQVKTIKMLSELRKFYLQRMEQSVDERKIIENLLDELQPIKDIDKELRNYFMSIKWAKLKI